MEENRSCIVFHEKQSKMKDEGFFTVKKDDGNLNPDDSPTIDPEKGDSMLSNETLWCRELEGL